MQLTTPKQIRQALQINKKQYKELRKEGMPYVQIGDKVRFNKEQVVEWLQRYIMKQEDLEKSFVDAKGRTIDAYVTLANLKERLHMKKKKLLQLCQEGMPHQVIGEKIFFNLEEVFAYFYFEKVEQPKGTVQQAPVLIIVDGSYDQVTKRICTGMVIQGKNGTKGVATLEPKPYKNSAPCEYLAIYHALVYAKEHRLHNVIIGTDQTAFISTIENGERRYPKWMRESPYIAQFREMHALLDELKDRVKLVYANDGKYDALYHNAHALSREYQNKLVESIELEEKLPVRNNLKENQSNLRVTPVLDEPCEDETTLRIAFLEMDKEFVYFQVTDRGVSKRTKMINTTATRAAIMLANTYVKTRKGKMTIYMEAMPAFKEDVKRIHSKYHVGRLKNIIDTLYKKANFYPVDSLENCLEVDKKEAITA